MGKGLTERRDPAESPGMKETTSYAKQLFMFGEGSTKPIKCVKKLSEVSGAPIETLRPWMPKWRAECRELALLHENSPYTIALSEEMLVQHSNEIKFLGKQVLKLRNKLKEYDLGSSNYIVTLSAYQSALTKWEKSSGILAHYDAAAAALREQAKATAKARAQRGDGQDTGLTLRKVNKERFDHG